jgi:L-alanine-DL-glutamate epimerase-like enolase superfamily enzyme
MKITDIQANLVEIPLPKEHHYAWVPGSAVRSVKFTLIKIFTDEGITGFGASHVCFGEEVMHGVHNLIKPYLIGKDPSATERHIETLYSAHYLGPVPWLVDQALWDIVGKAAGQPIYKLWGGFQDKVLAYGAPSEPRSPAEHREVIRHYLEKGFKAIKLRLHNHTMKEDLAIVETVRSEVGDRMEIMVDANQALLLNSPKPHPVWSYERALATARELERLKVFYLEEPLYIYNFRGIAQLTRETNIYIAGGEWNGPIHEFKWLLDHGCYDILQPDAMQSDGMFRMRQIAHMAYLDNKLFIPHTWGNGLGLIANLQVALSVPNCPFFEYPYDPETLGVEMNQAMIKEPLRVDAEGYIHAPKGPGLGVELNEDFIRRYTLR